jgi:undecaprenyl-diphosphatase
MEVLLELDQSLFIKINSLWSSAFLDALLPLCRDKLIWIPLYVFLISFILFNVRGFKALMIILLVIGSVGLSDAISSKVFKPQVERLRPCNDDALADIVIERVRCGGGYSFTSSHASNHFALSTILFLLVGRAYKWRYLLFLWAGLIAYAQVYVGVHYPLDVTIGGLFGILIGMVFFQIWKRTSFSALS